jgi:hypothetical protein
LRLCAAVGLVDFRLVAHWIATRSKSFIASFLIPSERLINLLKRYKNPTNKKFSLILGLYMLRWINNRIL